MPWQVATLPAQRFLCLSYVHYVVILGINKCNKLRIENYIIQNGQWDLAISVVISNTSHNIWRHRSGSTLAQVMACYLTASGHYLNQFWLIICEVLRHSPEGRCAGNAQDIYMWYVSKNYLLKITPGPHFPVANDFMIKSRVNSYHLYFRRAAHRRKVVLRKKIRNLPKRNLSKRSLPKRSLPKRSQSKRNLPKRNQKRNP